jgi:hypothetical protein
MAGAAISGLGEALAEQGQFRMESNALAGDDATTFEKI